MNTNVVDTLSELCVAIGSIRSSLDLMEEEVAYVEAVIEDLVEVIGEEEASGEDDDAPIEDKIQQVEDDLEVLRSVLKNLKKEASL